jgi:hypothetical protein
MSNFKRNRLKLRGQNMFRSKELSLENKKLKNELDRVKEELAKNKITFNYNTTKIEDDFNVLNQIIDLKMSHYKDIVFVYNRYTEEKRVNVTSEELDATTTRIASEVFRALSKQYLDYLILKYFSSEESMIEVYTQQIYMKLFAFANAYNTEKTQKDYKKSV